MNHVATRRVSGRFLFPPVAAALACILLARPALTTEVEPLSLNEIVRQADAIVVGAVTARESRWGDASHRWMVTDYTVAVEDVVHAEDPDAIGETITLTWWGGTIGSERQAIADLRYPAVGERLLVMLRRGWQDQPGFTPVVGFSEGLFRVRPGAAAVVLDAAGRPLGRSAAGEIVRREGRVAAASDTAAIDLASFSAWLRANVTSIRKTPSELRPAANSASSPTPYAGRPELPGSPARDANMEATTPRKSGPAEPAAGVPTPPPTSSAAMSIMRSTAVSPAPRVRSNYLTNHTAYAPIIINQFPSSVTPWSPEDQYAMSFWNYYGDNVFRVLVAPTGTYGWPNDSFDLAGFPSSANLLAVYGSGWTANTTAVTFLRYDVSNRIIEADIAFNPAFTFTLDDESIYDGGSAQGFRQTMTHELGHMHGLEHNFDDLSAMNYMPSRFRYFGMPYMDDAQGIRAEYPSNVAVRSDLGVYLYHASGSQSVTEATFPATVASGGSLTVNNYHVENVGTLAIPTPTIQWYLTTARHFNSGYYAIGTSTYSTLQTFSYFTPSTVSRTFTVPTTVPPGNYYLGAYIASDSGAAHVVFPYSNNYAFSRTKITVSCPTTTITASNNGPGCLGGSVQLNATTLSGATYAWTGPSGYTSTQQNPTVSALTAAKAGLYTVTVTFGNCTLPTASTTVALGPAAPPVNVVATALTPTSVSVTWSASACAATYDVYRNSGSGLVKIGSSGTTAYTDTTAAAGMAYLYAVKGVDSGAVSTAFSLANLATTFIFTDPALTTGTTVKAIHVTELRTAVAAVRTLAGLGSVTYTDPTLTAALTSPKPVHISELRTALNAARASLGLTAITYTDPTITTSLFIKAAHMNDLRNGVR